MSYRPSKRFPELYLRGRIWWAHLPTTEGKRPRESTGHTDEVAAHRWYLDRVRSTPSGPVEAAKERTVYAALSGRINWLNAAREHDDPTRKKLAADTIDFYESKSKPLLAILGAETLLSAIGSEEIRRYILERSKSCKGTTIAKELTTLSMAWKLADKDGVSCLPFSRIVPDDFAARYVPKTRWLPEDEVEAFCKVLNPTRVPLFLFLVATGATYPSEVHKIRPGHVVGSVVHVPGTKATTRDRFVHVPEYGRRFLKRALRGLGPSGFESWTNIRGDLHDAARRLSMCPACRDALRRQGGRLSAVESGHGDTVLAIKELRASGLTYEQIATELRERGTPSVRGGTWFKASVRKLALSVVPLEEPKVECVACEKTPEVAGCSPNDLRRTFAQWLVRSGVPYELAAQMMGHNSTKMLQQVYGRRDAAATAKLVEAALRNAPKGARLAG